MVRHHTSDRDLERRITSFLLSKHKPSLRQLGVKVHSGHVTLSGSVKSFYDKQLAISCAQRVAGVVGLTDQVGVVS